VRANCPRCGYDSRDGVKFCEECRGKLEHVGPSCGTVIPSGRKFCGECGQPIADTATALLVDRSRNGIHTWHHRGVCLAAGIHRRTVGHTLYTGNVDKRTGQKPEGLRLSSTFFGNFPRFSRRGPHISWFLVTRLLSDKHLCLEKVLASKGAFQ